MNSNSEKSNQIDKVFSENLRLIRRTKAISLGSDENASPIGPGSAIFQVYSDGSVKYDLRAFPVGPGIFGHNHPLICRINLKFSKIKQKAKKEEIRNVHLKKEELMAKISLDEREILLKNFPSQFFLTKNNFEEQDVSFFQIHLVSSLIRLLNEAPYFGEKARIFQVKNWIDQYSNGLERKGLTINVRNISEKKKKNLFLKGLHFIGSELIFPLSIEEKHIKEIFSLLEE